MNQGAQAEILAGDITRAIENDDLADAAFDALALRLFAYQYEHNAPYRRFCAGRGVAPSTVNSWRDVPPAPAAAFKRFALTCAPEEACSPDAGGRVFHSSGTTGSETSRHFMDRPALDLYRTSLKAGYARFVPPTLAIFALMPPPAEAPYSSLSFMLEELGAWFFWRENWREVIPLWIRTQRKYYTLFGTAFAWIHLFDSTDGPLWMSPDCVVVETGGFKGRSREIRPDELYGLFHERLGVEPERCLSEYGMSEMASQFYDSVAFDKARGVTRTPRKVGPPWLRTRVLDPVTGMDAAPGAPGLLAHYDLANLNSVFAIQTEDRGIAADDGDGFVLLGRAPDAILRGCSLLAEERMNPPLP